MHAGQPRMNNAPGELSQCILCGVYKSISNIESRLGNGAAFPFTTNTVRAGITFYKGNIRQGETIRRVWKRPCECVLLNVAMKKL